MTGAAPLPRALFMELKQWKRCISPLSRFLHFNGAPYADTRTSGDGEKARRDRAVSESLLIDNPANVTA